MSILSLNLVKAIPIDMEKFFSFSGKIFFSLRQILSSSTKISFLVERRELSAPPPPFHPHSINLEYFSINLWHHQTFFACCCCAMLPTLDLIIKSIYENADDEIGTWKAPWITFSVSGRSMFTYIIDYQKLETSFSDLHVIRREGKEQKGDEGRMNQNST